MNVKLLTLLALGVSVPEAIFAQDSRGEENLKYSREYKKEKYRTFASESRDLRKFDNASKMFKDWSVSIGGGASFIQRGDLTSFYDSKMTSGYNAYVSLNKQVSHTFGLSLQYQMGKTTQKGSLASLPNIVEIPKGKEAFSGRVIYDRSMADVDERGVAEANTKYKQVSILGDINLSNLLRRVDKRHPFKWALHAYAGLGLQGYTTYRKDNHSKYPVFELKQTSGVASFFYQGGLGLKYNVNKLIDLEARAMYVITGDDEFDGGGEDEFDWYNTIRKNDSDNMLTLNLGMSFKLGGKKDKHHLAWYDPMQELYQRIESFGKPRTKVCEKGDKDRDGVCDDWDRQLDTPKGARIDGAGVALDIDLDGVIDLNDKCVVVPGIISNEGCPEGVDANQNPKEAKKDVSNSPEVLAEINRYFEGVEFGSDKAKAEIKKSSFENLDKAAELIKTLNPNAKYLVIGATDASGSELFNKVTSQKQSEKVVAYLVKKGVSKNSLIVVGKGKSELKYPECDPASQCPDWKNQANRRVYFQQQN